MFTVYCEDCNTPINIEKYPESSMVICTSCSQSIQLREHTHYIPSLLLLKGGKTGRKFPIRGTVSLGRAKYNTIIVDAPKASREHAVIKNKEEKYWFEDLKSGNGSYINNRRVNKKALQDGDIIKIVNIEFIFHNPYNHIPQNIKRDQTRKKAILTDKKTVLGRTKAELKFDAQHSFLMSSQELKDITDLAKINNKLRTLYEVNDAISSILDLQELLGKILDVVFQYLPAERGAILLYEEESDTLKSAVIKVRDNKSEEEIKISRTLLDRVVKERISLLTTDTMLDEQLAEAMSIITQGIRSAMSVPLISKKNLLGVLHIDSTKKSSQFSSDNLELLSGIASQAAVAIENAQLIKTIEKEAETRQHLQRYLSPELVEQVVNKQIDLEIGGQLKKATILFSDLRGFTKMTDTIGAEAVVKVLNDYFSRMVDIIFLNGGVLDKFIGDAIMAIWGMPIQNENDSLRAVEAAIKMQTELFYFNITQRRQKRNILKMGIGINLGDVVVGNMGSEKRMEYTVIGPPVNLASRVESLTSKNQVLISDNVYNEVKEITSTVELAPTRVKGINRPIQIYGVIGICNEKQENINFLPILLDDIKDPQIKYEGIIDILDSNKIIFNLEPDVDIEIGQETNFILDIPKITPDIPVKILCKDIELSSHREDEFLKIEADIIEFPEEVEKFLNNIFKKEE